MSFACVWEFAELEKFYARYEPCSPYGKAEKERREFIADRVRLAEIYRLTLAAIPFVSDKNRSADKLAYHMKRLPILPALAARTLDVTELFLVKKFLVNCEAINRSIGKDSQEKFGLNFMSEELLALLGQGSTDPDDETFYLAEKYSSLLAEVRAELRALDEKIKEAKRAHTEMILSEASVDLRFRDFVVIDAQKARQIPSNLVSLEPFDSQHFIAKPLLPRQIIDALSARDELLKREKAEEERVLIEISRNVSQHADKFAGYILALTRIDTALARARLAVEFALIEPDLGAAEPNDSTNLVAHGARFLPLEWRCNENKLRYWPLNVVFEKQANAIFGSNMGGKTVVLKTVVFLQLLAQLGFFVPANRFQTTVFEQISYVGATGSAQGNSADIEGLSGFGSEIHAFLAAWNKHKTPVLFAIDEFARTTNSLEASALVSAMLRRVAEEPGVLALVSTHFMDLKVPASCVAFFRMKGLNHVEYHKSYTNSAGGSLANRIRAINQFMQFELVEEKRIAQIHDAVAIAELLGLDAKIVEYARESLGDTHGRKTRTKS